MGFLRRLFGGGEKEQGGDPQGLYFYVECDNCGARVRLRADKQYDLNRTDDGYIWHKTVVDSTCFRQIPTVVHLDRDYNVTSAEIEGGHYITQEEYEAQPGPPPPAPDEDEAGEEDVAADEAAPAEGGETPGEARD
ncbi:MAG TPA: hypothetical protein VK879_05705 [Candidatus Sulfomarinibacteraceae bacterium]|nr:hypothetical protein [Candidatus Sulfomarinibacteraceae bacterium]